MAEERPTVEVGGITGAGDRSLELVEPRLGAGRLAESNELIPVDAPRQLIVEAVAALAVGDVVRLSVSISQKLIGISLNIVR